MWYLDCYCYAATDGSEVPVNSYSSEDPRALADVAGRLLARQALSGIDEVRIAESTKGVNPVPINESTYIGGLK